VNGRRGNTPAAMRGPDAEWLFGMIAGDNFAILAA
jgi:hypothetical protein